TSSVLNNQASGVLDIQSSTSNFVSMVGFNGFGNRGLFINSGTLRRSVGTTLARITVPINNLEGTIDVQSGTLTWDTSSDTFTGGTFNVATGATLNISTTVNMTGSYTGSGAGTVALAGGTLNIGAAGATFNFPTGLFQWQSGAIAGVGTLTNAAGAFMTL